MNKEEVSKIKKGSKRYFGVEQELMLKDRAHTWEAIDRIKEVLDMTAIDNVTTDCGCYETIHKPLSLKEVQNGKYLKKNVKALQPITKINKRGGTHVHISRLDSDPEWMTKNLIIIQHAFYKELQILSKRKSEQWAKDPITMTLSRAKAVEDKARDIEYKVRYNREATRTEEMASYARNYWMITPNAKETYEYRGGRGTKDIRDIRAWAEMLRNIVELSKQKSLSGVTFGQIVKGPNIERMVNDMISKGKLNKDIRKLKIVKKYKNKNVEEEITVLCA